jgi:hypothetical protein
LLLLRYQDDRHAFAADVQAAEARLRDLLEAMPPPLPTSFTAGELARLLGAARPTEATDSECAPLTKGAREMFQSATIRGPQAVIRWVYHQAARVGPWEVTTDGGGALLTAAVIEGDAFKLAQPGLTFRVSLQNGKAWTWPIESLQIAAGTLSARLGPQQE